MSTVWDEQSIREELAKLDLKTGLQGALLPINFNNEKCTLAMYSSQNGGKFTFSNYYFQNSNWPIEEVLDVIRHEHAHYYTYCVYGYLSHGSLWKQSCLKVGTHPIRCYREENAEYYRKKHAEEKRLSDRYDLFDVGTTIEHPKFGIGTIENIEGTGVMRVATVSFANTEAKKFLLSWIDDNCTWRN